jgi:predicted phage terminase large subunit-like protein
LEVLQRIRDDIGSFNFAAQYQQSPQTPDGTLFKRKYFKLVEEQPSLTNDGALFVSIDTAVSESNTADFTAISVVYKQGANFFVLFAERGRWDYEDLKRKAIRYIERLGRRDRPVTFVIEAMVGGISLLKYLRELRDSRVHCFSYLPKFDKVARAAHALPIFESGRVHIVNVAGRNDWVEPYINEFVNFPFGRFDDQVDSLTQLLPWAEHRGNPGGGFYAF